SACAICWRPVSIALLALSPGVLFVETRLGGRVFARSAQPVVRYVAAVALALKVIVITELLHPAVIRWPRSAVQIFRHAVARVSFVSSPLLSLDRLDAAAVGVAMFVSVRGHGFHPLSVRKPLGPPIASPRGCACRHRGESKRPVAALQQRSSL